jgi:hypothetical protein
VPREKAARQHPVGGDADPELAAGRQDLVLDPARDERVLDLHVGDGMNGVRPADRLRAHFREPEVTDVARLDQLLDRADRPLDRDVRKHPSRPVDVDVVGSEAAERVGEEVLHRRWP